MPVDKHERLVDVPAGRDEVAAVGWNSATIASRLAAARSSKIRSVLVSVVATPETAERVGEPIPLVLPGEHAHAAVLDEARLQQVHQPVSSSSLLAEVPAGRADLGDGFDLQAPTAFPAPAG